MRSDHGARHEMIPRRKPPSVPPSPRARVGVQAANPSRPPKTVLALYGSAHKQSVAPLALETASYAIATLSVSAERRRRRRREAVGAGLTKTQQRATRQRARPTASPSCCGQEALPRRALRHRRVTPRAGEVSAIRQCELVSGWGEGVVRVVRRPRPPPSPRPPSPRGPRSTAATSPPPPPPSSPAPRGRARGKRPTSAPPAGRQQPVAPSSARTPPGVGRRTHPAGPPCVGSAGRRLTHPRGYAGVNAVAAAPRCALASPAVGGGGGGRASPSTLCQMTPKACQ